MCKSGWCFVNHALLEHVCEIGKLLNWTHWLVSELPSNGTYNAPSDGWCGAWLTSGLLVYSPLTCQMYNHNCHEDIFDSFPKELNEVQFTVECGEYEIKVASHFNCLLYQRLLSTEVKLTFKDAFVTASIWNTFLGTFPMQIVSVETMLCEDSLNALWKIWVFWIGSGYTMAWLTLQPPV